MANSLSDHQFCICPSCRALRIGEIESATCTPCFLPYPWKTQLADRILDMKPKLIKRKLIKTHIFACILHNIGSVTWNSARVWRRRCLGCRICKESKSIWATTRSAAPECSKSAKHSKCFRILAYWFGTCGTATFRKKESTTFLKWLRSLKNSQNWSYT